MRSSTEAHKRRAALSKVKKVGTTCTHDPSYASFVMFVPIILLPSAFVNTFSGLFQKVFGGVARRGGQADRRCEDAPRSVAGRLPLPFKSVLNLTKKQKGVALLLPFAFWCGQEDMKSSQRLSRCEGQDAPRDQKRAPCLHLAEILRDPLLIPITKGSADALPFVIGAGKRT